jgi:hypothetical protein
MLYQHTLYARELARSGMAELPAFQTAFGAIGRQVSAEAQMLAFRDCFFVISVWFALVIFALFLMPKPNLQRPAPPEARMPINPEAA